MLDLTKQFENNSKIFLLDSRIGQNLILRSYPGIHVLSLNSSASHEAILAGNTVITTNPVLQLKFFLLIKLRFKTYFHTALPLHMPQSISSI